MGPRTDRWDGRWFTPERSNELTILRKESGKCLNMYSCKIYGKALSEIIGSEPNSYSSLARSLFLVTHSGPVIPRQLYCEILTAPPISRPSRSSRRHSPAIISATTRIQNYCGGDPRSSTNTPLSRRRLPNLSQSPCSRSR